MAQTQQQLIAQEQRQASCLTRACTPEPSESVSPQKLRALQETLQDLHAEVAELRGIIHQKNAELDSLHRCGHVCNNVELQLDTWYYLAAYFLSKLNVSWCYGLSQQARRNLWCIAAQGVAICHRSASHPSSYPICRIIAATLNRDHHTTSPAACAHKTTLQL